MEFKKLSEKKKEKKSKIVDWEYVLGKVLNKEINYSEIKELVEKEFGKKKLYYSEFLRVLSSWNSRKNIEVLYRKNENGRVVYKVVNREIKIKKNSK